MMNKLFFVVFLCGLISQAYAQLESDRFGKTHSAKVLDADYSQLESGFSIYKLSGEKLTYSAPEILFRRSLSNIHELQLQLPSIISYHQEDSSALPIGNMSVGVKLGVISSDKVNLSVLAKWGLLSDPLSLDRGGYLSLSAPIQVNLNEIMYTRAEITVNGIGGDLQRIGLLALGYKVGPKVNFMWEYQLNQFKSIQAESWNNRSSVGVAFQYETMNHLLLDLGVSNTFDSLLGLNIGEFYVVKAGLTHNWEQWRKRRNKNTPSEIY